VVASLLKQLVLPCDQLPTDLFSTFEDCSKNSQRPGLTDLVKLFVNYAKQIPPTAVFFDAFDECHSNQHEKIRGVVEKFRTAEIRVFITTRLHDSDELALDNAIKTEIRANDHDIENCILVELHDNKKRLDLEDSKRIAQEISSQADGM
jgi:hypothetical protein